MSGIDAVELKARSGRRRCRKSKSNPQRLFVQQLFEVFVEHWHNVGIGHPADRGSASRDQCFLRRPRAQVQANRPPPSSPASANFELESGFASGRAPAVREPAAFIFCLPIPPVCLLVFLLVSAAIGDENYSNSISYGIRRLSARGTISQLRLASQPQLFVRSSRGCRA